MTLPPLPEPHRAWQWLDTGTFRMALPANAEREAWNKLYSESQMREYAAAAVQAAVAAERKWRETVDDMLVTQHEVASDDPRESINRLINWNCMVALDPCVSSDAAALVERGRQEVAAKTGEPILWYRDFGAGPMICNPDRPDAFPLYPHPPARRPLTEEQIDELLDRERMKWSARTGPPTYEFSLAFARAVEAAHGITGETK